LRAYQERMIPRLGAEQSPERLRFGIRAIGYIWRCLAIHLRNSAMLIVGTSLSTILLSMIKDLEKGRQIDRVLLNNTLLQWNDALTLAEKGQKDLEELAHELLFRAQATPEEEQE